jgi:poly(A) polymerase
MRIDPTHIDADAAKVVRRLQHHGYKAYLVGGCVRDLLLGRTPKDFDVATSAEPNDVKRLFRNCRVIGRRFRLAHVFFGPKIIETSTFRQNPRSEDGDGADGEEAELLIRRDNVFGTAEEDARRRDFTINGLFYDLATEEVIDYVGGAVDLAAGLVRTIGDPDIRLREDPVRILRAIKFAARLGFTIEPATYGAILAHRGEIPKCAPPRILEEIYRLLRGGAAAASLRLLRETGALDVLVPELGALMEQAALPVPSPAPAPAPPAPLEGGGAVAPPAVARPPRPPVERLFATLDLIDAWVRENPTTPPSNAVILGAVLWPFLDDVLAPDLLKVPDAAARLDDVIGPVVTRIRASRRDCEQVRQLLLAQRRFLQAPRRRHRPAALARRDHFLDALLLFQMVAQVRGLPGEDVERWRRLLGQGPPEQAEAGPAPQEPGRRRRRRRGGRRRRRPERFEGAQVEQ